MSWYYASGNDKLGPVDDSIMTNLVKSGNISRTTMVWRDGMENWKQAGATELAVQFPASLSQNAMPSMMDVNLVYPSTPPNSPHLAWLNIVLPGIAQVIMGQTGKGFTILLGGIVLTMFSAGLFLLVLWPLSIIDGYFVGNILKSGRPVGKWAFFPK